MPQFAVDGCCVRTQNARLGDSVGKFNFVPDFADGSTIYGMTVATHRVNGVVARKSLFRDRSDLPLAMTSSYASGFIHSCEVLGFRDARAAEVALKKHTLFGFYEKGRTRGFSDRECSELLKSGKNGRLSKPSGQALARLGLRWCAECASEDHAAAQPPSWRVVHQVPYVHHCPTHRTALLFACGKCGTLADEGNNRRLPGDPCRNCKSLSQSAKVRPHSDGYWALVDNVQKTFREELPWVRADAWYAAVLSEATGQGLVEEDGLQLVRDAVLGRWGVSNESDLLELLSFSLSEGLNLLDIQSSLVSPTLLERLLVADGIASIGLGLMAPAPTDLVAVAPSSGGSNRDALRTALLSRAMEEVLSSMQS